ncbi:glycosyl transferase family 1 [Thermaurantimonas aggregans]|uniref:Glycosyl transferase family 1 n=1 Tax=Thermaurantimonas aggregans TaxID=2173829 RepID=A0A401XHS4_9FLAO|nr:glycosyltransferase family 1 protein [Thermaurantimonas aggregans]MCX8149454.1 glycosyltransferase family 4 protein [Thermaurantimonas aggregans]GCD76559.1 glycosyl transferase family 1 [Thermaurantimonas aggregans]
MARIGFEAQRIFRAKKHGMDFVALELLKALSKIDKQNEYFVYINEGEDPCFESHPNFKVIVHKAPYPVWEQHWLPKRAKADKLDLLHCTSNTAPIWLDVPLMVTLHDVIYLEKNPLFAPGYTPYQRFGNMYRRWVVKTAIPQANRVLTVSQYEVGNVLKFLPQIKDRLHVLYNGVGAHFQKITDSLQLNTVRKKYHLPEKFIMFLGNTDPKKNTENTLKAYALIAKETNYSYKLLLGDLDKQFVKNILDRNNLSELFNHIHFTGYIKNSDLPAILSQAEVFLYPSLRESFGIPIIEAMACGTPVVTSSVTSMPEVAGDAALLADPTKPDDIASAALRLLSDVALRNQLIEKGLERAKLFNWENSASQLISHYRELT